MTASPDIAQQRFDRWFRAVAVSLGVLLAAAGVITFTGDRAEPSLVLPNPMGGPAIAAPGVVEGHLDLPGLSVAGAAVQMGQVPLDVTVVPTWELTTTGDVPVTVVVGQPQVHEGCCPGPVYADGQLVQPGDQVSVSPGQPVHLHFPLQMHAGMDGPHRLAVPLSVDGETGHLEVTGDFTGAA